jgi:hypothetical protein
MLSAPHAESSQLARSSFGFSNATLKISLI